MMLTIRNLKKNDVIPLLLALPKQTVFSLEELEDAPTPKEKATPLRRRHLYQTASRH